MARDDEMTNARPETEPEVGWGRAFWHMCFGVAAIVLGQVIQSDDAYKVSFARWVCGFAVGADLLVRLPLYHLFVKPTDVTHWGRVRRGLRIVCMFLEEWLLIKPKILRPKEREKPATVVPFALGVLIPIQCGFPLWAVMLGVIVLGFGDPWARVIGLKSQWKPILENGGKTWSGFWGFILVASAAVVFSGILDWWFPVYPTENFGQLLAAMTAAVFVGGFAELLQELIKALTEDWRQWLRWFVRFVFDDNLMIPIVVSGMAVWIMSM